MNKNLKKWLIPVLMTLGGAALGVVYSLTVGCVSGSCAITSSPVISALYLGTVGFLLSRMFTGSCCCSSESCEK